MAGCDGACAKRPATAVLARRAWCATAGSFSGSSSEKILANLDTQQPHDKPSYNGGGPNFRNGKVFVAPGGALVGD